MTTRKTKAKTASAPPQSAGEGMLALFSDLWRTFKYKDEYSASDERKNISEYEGTYEVMRSMSFVRPSTAKEALAQAIFIQNEMGDPGNTTDDLVEISERIVRRACGLILWIEQTHGIDHREIGLEDFCHIYMKDGLFPDAPIGSRPEAQRAAMLDKMRSAEPPQAAE